MCATSRRSAPQPDLAVLPVLRRESAAAGFAPAIDPTASVPAVRQLYLQLRDGIVSGSLHSGHRLPSTRMASTEWRLSRGVIAEAYEMLIAEGYAIGRHGSGTYVVDDLREAPLSGRGRRSKPVGSGRRSISSAAQEAMNTDTAFPTQIAFATGRVGHDERTSMLLKRLAYRHLDYARDGYRDPQGEPSLRDAVTAHITASRGVRCSPEQVFITSGTQQGLDLAIRTLLSPGEIALVEDPCYPPARAALAVNGAKIVGVPVDGNGMMTEALERCEAGPAVIFVTPSHQYPCGGALPLQRRLQLLAFAQQRGSWIIEDDYDSEFRYEGHAIASLQGLDANERVVYVGSFSKALLPGLRVGYLVVPRDLVDAFRAVRPLIDRFPAPLNQLVVADFLNEGYYPAHLRRLRESYRSARDTVIELIERKLDDHLLATVPEQGVHLVVASRGSWTDDRAIARAALKNGVVVTPVSPMHISAPPQSRLLLGFSGLAQGEADIAIKRLRKAFLN